MPKKSTRVPSKRTASPARAKPAPLKNQRLYIIFAAIALLVIGAAAFLIIANPLAAEEADLGNLPGEINVSQAYNLYQQGAFLLDVRTQEEWDASHVPDATLIPLDQLENRLGELPRDQEIVVICRSGNRSQVGRDILRQAGFNAVTSVSGGIQAWSASGFPVLP
jgi:rhodanese-related sulfurtransferase